MVPKGEVVSTCQFRSICMYHILADVFCAMNIFVTIPSMPGLWYFCEYIDQNHMRHTVMLIREGTACVRVDILSPAHTDVSRMI